MDKSGERSEKIFTAAVLFFFTGAFYRSLYGMYDPTADASTGNLLANSIWASIYLISAWLLKTRCGGLWSSISNLRPFFWLYGVAIASIAWSDAPLLTFLRFGALAGTTLFGLYLGTRFSLKMILVLLGWAYGIGMTLSIIFSLLFPGYSIGTGPFAGMWMGIYQHKNILGINMSMAFIVFLTLAYCFPAKRWHFRILACAAVMTIFFANSATSFVECIAMCWFFPFLARLQPSDRPRRASTFLLAATGIPLALSPFIFYTQIIMALGRDVEMTGRFGLWYLVAQYISQRPLLGYGYFAFWRGVDGPLGQFWVLGAASSHDGFLDIWLDLGLVGFVAFLAAYITYVKRSLSTLRHSRSREDIWPLLLLSWTVLSNLTESTFLRPNRFPWMLLITAVAALSVRRTAQVRDESPAGSGLAMSAIGS